MSRAHLCEDIVDIGESALHLQPLAVERLDVRRYRIRRAGRFELLDGRSLLRA